MTKYTETVKVGPTTTSTLFVQTGKPTFSWAKAMPEGDPLSQAEITEIPEEKKAAVKRRGSKG